MKTRISHKALVALIMLAAALVLVACGQEPAQEAVSNAPAAGGSVVSGTVTYLDRSALDPTAVIEVELVDASATDGSMTVVASQSVNADGRQVPLPFELPYDPAQINPSATYLVNASILVNGQVQYTSQVGVPVITNGAPTSNVEVVVSPAVSGTMGGALTGVVTYLDRSALPPDAVVDVELQDTSTGIPTVIESTSVNTQGQQVPIPFSLAYDPATIDPAGTYLLNARISAGGVVLYASPAGIPVLTNGGPTSNVEVIVSPVGAPAVAGAISGTVTTPIAGVVLEPGTVMQVELREPMLADAPAVAQVQLAVEGLGFPISFELPYDASVIAADRSYVVAARILRDNQLLYTSLAPVPVLTGGAPASNVVVRVAAVPDAGWPARLTGTVTSAAPASFGYDSDAVLQVELREPMLADAPAMVFSHLPLAGLSFPVAFELPYDPATIDPNRDYIVDARVIDNGQLAYTADAGVPVITKGAPTADVQVPVSPTPTDAPPGGFITGTITTDQPQPLDPAAVYYVDFREAGSTGDPIVTISATLEGQQFPIPFEVPYDPASIDPAKSYVVGARILQGEQVLYASAVGVPVLTQGAPATDVVVNIPPQ